MKKRSIVLGLALLAVVSAYGQASFTIRRPANGSVVREVVKMRIPKSSLSAGSYVGIMINGKLLEAVSPTPDQFEGNDFVYSLDTKAREIPDGPLKLEAVLYGVFGGEGGGENHAIVNRSSVRVTLDNRASLNKGNKSYTLRYKLNPGKEFTYRLDYSQSVSIMSEAQAKLGGRAPELPQGSFSARYLYAIDNAYGMGNGRKEGLLRMQILPTKGKNYAILPLSTDPTPKRRYEEQFVPVYYRMTDTGREVFGRAPAFFGVEGTSGSISSIVLYGVFPPPILPTRSVKQGDSWSSAIVTSSAIQNLADIYSMEKVSTASPARGTIEAIEWERGMRCVRIRNRIASSTAVSADVQQENEEVYWFSLDLGMVVKLERTFTTTSKVKSEALAGAAGGPDDGGASGGRARNRPTAAGASAADWQTEGTNMRQQSGPGRRGGGGGGDGEDDFGRSNGGGGGGAGAGARRAGGGTRIIKSRVKFVLTLE